MIEPARVQMSEPPRAPTPLPPSARELRRARARRLAIRFALGVGVPTLLSIVYYGCLAAPQYDSITVLAVESSDGRTAEPSRGRREVAGNQHDARLLRAYIQSHTMLDHLAVEHGLIAHYQGDAADWWSGLAADAGSDDVLAYYRDKVVVAGESTSNLLTLRVRAFDPDKAQEIGRAIVAGAEAWTRELGERARREQLEPAEREVTRARERLGAARAAMLQATGGVDLDPDTTTNPAVMEHELAKLALEGALEGLLAARLDGARAQRHLVVIAAPSLPDQVSRPRPVWDVATVFVTALVLVSVLSLLGAAVREHANF